jgi:hypothetical protein
MENKYYTPAIEEFHVGFEYESLYNQHSDLNEQWIKVKVGDEYIFNSYFRDSLKLGRIRVRCLDQQDIEDLGFNHFIINEELEEYSMYSFISNDNNFILTWINIDWNKIPNVLLNIGIKRNESDNYTFRGTVKNKSELKKILQQIGIND